MWIGYVTRELTRRRRQAIAVVAGLGLAVAVVIVVSGIGAGLRSAQSQALASLYGVGTDLTISQAAAPGTGAPQFGFSAGSGSSSNGTTSLAQSKLIAAKGVGTVPASRLSTVASTAKVTDAAAVLLLDNYDFSGLIPSLTGQSPAPGAETGGADGAGGSSFSFDTFRVAGVDVQHRSTVGLLSGTRIVSGRGLTSADAGQKVVVVDRAYALDNQLAVGGTLNVGAVDLPIVGLIASSTAGVATGASAYLPLDLAQKLSSLPGQISHVYVSTGSAADVPTVASALRAALPGAIVQTQADLASTITGSLSSASAISTTIGGWLTAIAVLAAVLFAALFTVIGVARRTREFGTLKAIGWNSRQIVAQVAGESLVQGVLGAVVGVAVGAIALAIVDAVAPGFTANLSSAGISTSVRLSAGFPVDAALLAAGLALGAALLAAVAGGLRIALLRPADALRSAE